MKMVLAYFKRHFTQDQLAHSLETSPIYGTAHASMADMAKEEGLYVYTKNDSNLSEISDFLEKGLPIIINFIDPSSEEGHYAVVSGITYSEIILADPWNGRDFRLGFCDFLDRWHSKRSNHWLMVISQDML